MHARSLTMKSWHRRSSSSVVTPGLTYSPIISSTCAASLPAVRIFSISSLVRRLTVMFLFAEPRAGEGELWYKARPAIKDSV